MNLSFASPQYLYALLGILPLIILYIYTLDKRPATIRFSALRFFPPSPQGIRVWLRHIPFVLRTLAWGLLIFILARPVSSSGLHELEKSGINIVIALDISTSMKDQDLAPNRLEVAKAKAEQFIAKRSNDRIGLVLFGNEAFLQCPLTLDHQALTAFVQDINFVSDISSQTAIGNAITMAVIALKRGQHQSGRIAPTNTPPANSTSQVIVLITDGRNTSGELDPHTAAQLAASYGIKIYTIGIGQPAAAQPPTAQSHFYSQSLLNETTLRDVADLTGGQYFNVQNNRALELTFAAIDNLEKVTFYEKKHLLRAERYLPFALTLFGVIVLELLLSMFVLRKHPA